MKPDTQKIRNRSAPSGFYLKGPFAQKQPVVRRNMFRSYLSADDNRSAILDYRGQHLGITLVEHSILVALGP